MTEGYKIRGAGNCCVVVDGVPPLIQEVIIQLYDRYSDVRYALRDGLGTTTSAIPNRITDLIGNEVKNPYSIFNPKHKNFEEMRRIAREALPIIMQFKPEILEKSTATLDDVFSTKAQ